MPRSEANEGATTLHHLTQFYDKFRRDVSLLRHRLSHDRAPSLCLLVSLLLAILASLVLIGYHIVSGNSSDRTPDDRHPATAVEWVAFVVLIVLTWLLVELVEARRRIAQRDTAEIIEELYHLDASLQRARQLATSSGVPWPSRGVDTSMAAAASPSSPSSIV